CRPLRGLGQALARKERDEPQDHSARSRGWLARRGVHVCAGQGGARRQDSRSRTRLQRRTGSDAMALDLRTKWGAVCALTLGLSSVQGCTPKPEIASGKQAELSFRDAPPQAGRDTVVVLTPLEQETREMWTSLVQELGSEFNVATVPVSRTTGTRHLAGALERLHPACVVVVDNRTLELYRQLQSERPTAEFPPAVVVMTSYLERAI